MPYTLVKRIKTKDWAIRTKAGKISKRWKKAHIKANKATLKKYGGKVAKAINKIKLPRTELLGSWDSKGHRYVSSRVPKSVRKAIDYHEKVEYGLLHKRKRKK